MNRENLKRRLSKYLEKLHLRKQRPFYIESEVYRPTTIALADIYTKPDVKRVGGTLEDENCTQERLIQHDYGNYSATSISLCPLICGGEYEHKIIKDIANFHSLPDCDYING